VINLNLPVGDHFGWGVCGKYIARELAHLRPGGVRLLTTMLNPQAVADELELLRLSKLLPHTQAEIADVPRHPLLQAITGSALTPLQPELRGSRTVGYTFFEDSRLTPAAIESARTRFDLVATGSTWCTQILQDHGVPNTATIIQGIDPNFFFPHPRTERLFPDRFVVFSGGKFELRKGQDLVIRAFKVLHDRHKDVMLVTAWYNQWPFSWQTMNASPYIQFAPRSDQYFEALNQIYADNGVDPQRTLNLAPRSNQLFPHIYRNTDCGLFPNRCEGGTNLVLMEYMACARAVIATHSTGHADVITRDNALVIDSPTTKTIQQADGTTVADWPEPNLEQTIELLEHAYQNREQLNRLAARAADDMKQLTWRKTAEGFLKLLV
jgi:glycosyltransferase involved in cell wall biosynthesis